MNGTNWSQNYPANHVWDWQQYAEAKHGTMVFFWHFSQATDNNLRWSTDVGMLGENDKTTVG